MFQKISPEKAGVRSQNVLDFIAALERRGVVMHSVLLMKGEDLFAEYYWKPFHKDLCHRMYSQTKSFVGVAIGLLEEDGLLKLDDPVHTYFPDKIDRELPPYLKELTIRQMLMMQTSGAAPSWFFHPDPDRTHLYFSENSGDHPAGTQWKYDSPGSQVLCALVERLAGRSLFDFLNERIFRALGTFQTATILKTKTEDSFGDSALLCTTRDIASFGRFVMNYGMWHGKRLMNEAYLRTATSRLADKDRTGFAGACTDGYGYQIWSTPYGGFAFNGMGAQLTICIPEKDLIFSCTGDNQGFPAAKDLICSAFYELIVEHMSPASLPEDAETYRRCLQLEEKLTLSCLKGETTSPFAENVNGKTYLCGENPMGIREFSLEFLPDGTGVWHYLNEQGEKSLPFGLGKNVFCKFPQKGYSSLHAGLPDENNLYDCACSAVWGQKNMLKLKVQIIDQYLGNLFVTFSFRDDLVTVTMEKTAEAFLNEYKGNLVAHQAK